MSYEYHLNSNIQVVELYEKVKRLISESDEYVSVFEDDTSSGFKIKHSESKWPSDIELSFTSEFVFLAIHSGNSKKTLKHITDNLSQNDIIIDIEEQ